DGVEYLVTLWFGSDIPGWEPGHLIQAIDGRLYVTTGWIDFPEFSPGSVVGVDLDGTSPEELRVFDNPVGGTGRRLESACLVEGSDGAFYGIVVEEGGGEHGRLFKLSRDAAHTYTPLHDFVYLDPVPPISIGSALIEGSDGMLYGIISNGGRN